MGISGSQNGGTVPYKAIFSGDIPLHRPYIGNVPTHLPVCSPATQSNTHCDRTDFLRSSRSRFHLGHRTSKICHKHSPRAKICEWHGDSTTVLLCQYIILSNLITANVICDAVRLRTVSRSLQEVLQFRESDQQIQELWFYLSLSLSL